MDIERDSYQDDEESEFDMTATVPVKMKRTFNGNG